MIATVFHKEAYKSTYLYTASDIILYGERRLCEELMKGILKLS